MVYIAGRGGGVGGCGVLGVWGLRGWGVGQGRGVGGVGVVGWGLRHITHQGALYRNHYPNYPTCLSDLSTQHEI